jgi:protease-4
MSEPTTARVSPVRRFFRAIGRVLGVARSFITNLLFVLFLVFVLASLFGGGAPRVPDRAALVIAPTGSLVDQTTQAAPLNQLLGDQVSETRLRDVVEALERAATDERIPVVVLNLGNLSSAGFAHLEAIGVALSQAKAAGKEIIAIDNYYTQGQYYLASFADTVYMNPMGQVLLTGYGGALPYFKELLDKLKVNIHVFRVGTFKDAVEPFTQTEMSAASREANQALVDTLWSDYRTTIAANRGVDASHIDNYVNQFADLLSTTGGDMARLALEQKMVDELVSHDEIRSRLIDKVGKNEMTFSQINHREYLAATKPTATPQPDNLVGVITARGNITMGDQPLGTIGSETLTKLIRKARDDKKVKAVVLRVDTPGGSAFASELIRQELELLQVAGKPLVVSMSGAAASGGYWIAANADEIWAAPTTITGSIGVFGIVPTFEESLAAIGVRHDGVTTSPLGNAMSPISGIHPPMDRILQANVEHSYARFLNLVARGREMLPEDVDAIAQGRVWTGRKAQELGLVDHLGHLADATAAAAKLAELDDYTVRHIEKELSPGEQLVRQITENMGITPPQGMAAVWGVLRAVGNVATLNDPGHLYLVCDSCQATGSQSVGW